MADYASRSNIEYIDSLYLNYKQNPQSVALEWQKFFEGFELGLSRTPAPKSVGSSAQGTSGQGTSGTASPSASPATLGGAAGGQMAGQLPEKELRVYELIQAYRNFGHLEADLDPLTNTPTPSDQLALAKFGLSDADLDSPFQVAALVSKGPSATLREIIQHLKKAYCGTLSVQFSESLPEVRNWFLKEFEGGASTAKPMSLDQKKEIFHSLARAESLEKFIHTRYVGAKRFSIEGGDALMPMLESLVSHSAPLGVKQIMIGMAHRGRVNVLANFMGKALENIFADFNGPTETSIPIEDFDGDVKYHLGYSSEKQTTAGPVQVTLAFNPSHLEAVNPVILGMTRAAQRWHKDTQTRKKVIPVLIHGDAAFAGQGVGLETFQMSMVKGYTVGGTIHVAIDNQVGFTTSPENARSSHYCTDVSKVLGAPVLHVNGDDAEACVRSMEIALKFRQEWGRDIVINLVCYRRFGHNEGDEPAYTQPLMYDIIKKHPTLKDIYVKQLVRDGHLTQSYADSFYAEKMDNLQKVYEQTKLQAPKIAPFAFEGFWKGLRKAKPEDFEKSTNTSFNMDQLKKLGPFLYEVPSGFSPHPKLKKLLETRKSMLEGKEPLDWGTAELLSYGSLLMEGTSVRLTGQDCVRGTFTHRHAGLYDVKTGEPYFGLDQINPEKVEFCVYDSILSEYGVLGFEYGNAIADPTFLTLWEAQFGDFSNGAQIIIDQFLTAGEAKWQQMSGLVLLLPHGYEGQGPEHSSARFERFLQLSAQLNIQVVNLTTPAQIFHALRRQIKRPFRKPLVVMSPKSLLRHPRAVSSLSDLAQAGFQEVIPDTLMKDQKEITNLALCTGKLYYELLEEREKSNHTHTALVRVEQVYPTPLSQIAKVVKSYPNLKNLIWVQEEPKNMGAYQFLYFKLSEMLAKEKLNHLNFVYVGRGERSSPATGSIYRHKVEQSELIKNCFQVS